MTPSKSAREPAETGTGTAARNARDETPSNARMSTPPSSEAASNRADTLDPAKCEACYRTTTWVGAHPDCEDLPNVASQSSANHHALLAEKEKELAEARDGIMATLKALDDDPHDWSLRTCPTCDPISARYQIIFGCTHLRAKSALRGKGGP